MKRGACLAVVVLLAAAACGGAGKARLSKNGYEAKLRAAFAAANTDLAAAPRAAGSAAFLTRVASAYGGIASSLKDVRPPADVQALNEQLLAGAAKEAASLNALLAALERASTVNRERLLAEFDPSRMAGRREFDHAAAGLAAKGYRFRPSAGA